MKKNQPTAPPVKSAQKKTRAPRKKREPVTLRPTAAQLATWRQKAEERGFKKLEEWAVYTLTAVAWPSDRLSVICNSERFHEWNTASLKEKMQFLDWITQTLDAKAFAINNAEQIEAVLDERAFAKAAAGGPISLDEFERSQRYRANHPKQAAEADRRRPVECPQEALLRDKSHEESPPSGNERE
ncbi:MAG: hypothetical protein V4819_20195 [Verrucomicrobiota bacterium]